MAQLSKMEFSRAQSYRPLHDSSNIMVLEKKIVQQFITVIKLLRFTNEHHFPSKKHCKLCILPHSRMNQCKCLSLDIEALFSRAGYQNLHCSARYKIQNFQHHCSEEREGWELHLWVASYVATFSYKQTVNPDKVFSKVMSFAPRPIYLVLSQ